VLTLTIGRHILKSKAEETAIILNIEFKLSSRWIDRIKNVLVLLKGSYSEAHSINP
jgi:hypothetical protein